VAVEDGGVASLQSTPSVVERKTVAGGFGSLLVALGPWAVATQVSLELTQDTEVIAGMPAGRPVLEEPDPEPEPDAEPPLDDAELSAVQSVPPFVV